MKITKKVKYALIAVWVFAVFTIMLGTMFIGRSYLNAVYGDKFPTKSLYSLKDPIMEAYKSVSSYKEELRSIAENSPELFLDEKYVQTMNERSQEFNTYVVIKVDDNYTFSGLGSLEEELKNQLEKNSRTKDNLEENAEEEQEADNDNEFIEYMITSPSFYLCNQIQFQMGEQNITISLLTYYGNYLVQFRHTLIKYVLLMLMIMLVLSAVLSALVYVQFVKPLVNLKKAAEEIGSGNLDIDIEVDHNRKDELGELCRSFDEMKTRLSETVDLKIQYEAENRELISNISHDLKTPITTIKGYVEGIVDGVADTPEKRDRYLKMIYNKANELDVLINELSLYTNINNNAIPYDFHRVSVKDYFDDCMEEIQATLISNDMTLIYKNYCKNDVQVVVDPDQLKRVINNIITNAIKYSDKERGQVEIYLHDTGEAVKVSIGDNGRGISEENLSHIFDRTFREDSARRSSGGSGLGLAICKKIVEEHGGTIWAKSQKGYGTTILFTLKKYIKEEIIDE